MIDARLPRSPRQYGRAAAKTAAATTAALLAFGFTAGPAMADETYDGGAGAQYNGNVDTGYKLDFGDRGTIGTTLFELTLKNDNTTLPAYCIDFETTIVGGAKYDEAEWDEYPGEGKFADAEPGKVHWILQNSYPTAKVEELQTEAEVEDLDAEEALSATQAAIWHYSNGVELKSAHTGDDAQAGEDIKALYNHLIAEATPVKSSPASLTIAPQEASGKAGESIGEFTVETTAENVPLTVDGPEGVTVIDAEGNEITEIANGGTFAVQVPEDTEKGGATVSSSITTAVQLGRLFKGIDPEKPTQTLITAGEGETEASAQAEISWTEGKGEEPPESPEPTDEPTEEPSESPEPTETPDDKPTPEKPEDDGGLPVTGAALGGLVAAAVAALGTGGGAMYLSRKRKSSEDHG